MKNGELCIPAAALADNTEDGQSMSPGVGDEVELSVTGVVTKTEGGELYVRPTAVNGQSLPSEGTEDGLEDEDASDEHMGAELNRMSSYVMALVAALVLWALPATAQQDLRVAQGRSCSVGAVSNWVDTTIEWTRWNTVNVWFTNAPANGTLTYVGTGTSFIMWTNNTAAATNHLQVGATAALSATALTNYVGTNAFPGTSTVTLQNGTNVTFTSVVRGFGRTTPDYFGSNSVTTGIRSLNTTNSTYGGPQRVFRVDIQNFTGATAYLMTFDSGTNRSTGANPDFTAIPVANGAVGTLDWGPTGVLYANGINVCLSTTPFSLTNAASGGTATVIFNPVR